VAVDEDRTTQVTRLLALWGDGDAAALDELFPLVYDELRRLAAGLLRRERPGHTLETAALVHEAYFRLTGRREASVKDRAHFLAVAAQAMRRILVDHARRQRAGKRIGPRDKVALDQAPELAVGSGLDVLALNYALSRLTEVNPRQTRVVELRYFAGLSNEEVAEVLAVSLATVERDWHAARLWLRRELERSPLDG